VRTLEDPGAAENFIAQSEDAFQDEQRRAFTCLRSHRRSGLDLEAGNEVVGEGGEDLPGGVARMILGRDGVEGITGLEFADGLLVSATPGEEAPEGLETEFLVGGDGRVLPGAVAGVEEIELEVLSGLVEDALTVDGDPDGSVPGGNEDGGLEGVEVGPDVLPAFAFLDQTLEVKPGVEGDTDGVLGSGFEESHDFLAEEGPIQPDLQEGLGSHVMELPEQVPQEREGGFAVMNVAGAVLDPKELGGLGKKGRDGIVAGDLAAVWVVATEGALNVQPGGEDGAVHIHRETTQVEPIQCSGEDIGVESMQSGPDGGGAPRKPPTQGALSRQELETAEPMNQRVSAQVSNMPQARGPDQEHGDQEANHPHRGEVPGRITLAKMVPESFRELDPVEELPEQFQAGKGSEPVIGKTKGQVGLDGSGQIAFSMSHRWWPFGSSRNELCHFFLYDRKAHSARGKAASFTGDRLFLHPVLTDQG